MKHLKSLLLLTLISTSTIALSQSKYIITYDKLEDNFSYEKVLYDHGRETFHTIKKPRLSFGDVVIVRAKNTNEFVFDMKLSERHIIKDNENSASRLLSGFSPMLGGLAGRLGGAVSEFSEIASYPPDPLYGSRGDEALSESELFNVELNKKTVKAYEIAKLGIAELRTLQENTAVIYAEDKTLDEIKLEFGRFTERFDMKGLIDQVDELNNLLSDIDQKLVGSDYDLEGEVNSEIKALRKSINKLNEEFNDEENPITENLFDDIQSELENADFEIQHIAVAQSNGYNGAGTLEDINEIEYSIQFEKLVEDEEDSYGYSGDDSYKFDNTQMIRKVKIKTDRPNLPQWSTGIVFVTPFSGTPIYTVARSEWSDSLLVSSTSDNSLLFSIATNIMYEFNVNSPVLPHVSGGMALGILDENNRRVSFLLGGGFRFSAFSFLSVNAGISFTQSNVLREEYQEDTWFEVGDNLDDQWGDFDADNLYDIKFKPGYYFGLNIHF